VRTPGLFSDSLRVPVRRRAPDLLSELDALTGHALRAQRNARAKAQMIVSEEVLDNEARVNAQLTMAYVRLQRL
jgi:hypothetical protein